MLGFPISNFYSWATRIYSDFSLEFIQFGEMVFNLWRLSGLSSFLYIHPLTSQAATTSTKWMAWPLNKRLSESRVCGRIQNFLCQLCELWCPMHCARIWRRSRQNWADSSISPKSSLLFQFMASSHLVQLFGKEISHTHCHCANQFT